MGKQGIILFTDKLLVMACLLRNNRCGLLATLAIVNHAHVMDTPQIAKVIPQ